MRKIKHGVPPFDMTVCPYCGSHVILTSNSAIYGREYGNGKCYKCTKCDAYVGVHTGTRIPLGRLANKELRELKKKCHALFDPMWKSGEKSRGECYRWLSGKLQIPLRECHFGWFDKEQLLQSLNILEGRK